MRFLLLVFLTLAVAFAIDTPNKDTRITGGDDAGENEFPFTVGILISGDEEHTFCAGVLVTPRFVLTTANCVIRQTMLTVLLGSSDITRMNQFLPVTHVRLHWNHSNTIINRADLALLTLARDATLGPSVAVARLPSRSQVGNTFNGFGATVIGWGLSGNRVDETVPVQHLQVVRNPIISNFVCGLSHSFITDEHVCTSGDNGGPCDGDEGGPVMITENGEPTVIAIHSFHFGRLRGCERGRSAVHTRLTEHLDWLVEHTGVEIRP
ncbi:brachyurin-like [Sabethes cyaneus]|uniref:brachyurin-like n=1 Tax=Sabethes cyaneus TaxID=53552 RepID=UPI00237DB012|nr:brachyurin-like [Sabethes cyaneus]